MRIEEKFTVDAPADDVWAFLTDPERVAAALPGAEITEKLDENTYRGGMGVKVGPLNAVYGGTVAFDLDEDARSAIVHAKGQGKAGMGNADMKMTSRVVSLGPSESEVTVEADLRVTGILAQLGRGMMQHVSKKMFKEFTEVLEKELS
ncbi:MAG: SRPBCC family protein [Gemmatimonadetes bacterium]|nr:SRPBCC family protein [Gemmatimonadota bacterium]